MTNAQKEQAVFWKMFEEKLIENGEPFSIAHRSHYATINRKNATSSLCLSMDFLVTKGFLRVGIYINEGMGGIRIFDSLYNQRDVIERELGFVPRWTMHGEKREDARRIEIHLPFTAYDYDDYDRVIEKSLPYIVKFIDVFGRRIRTLFNV